VERFFRSVREQFLCLQLDLSSLEALNRQFTHWVEEDYNAHVHSILGMSPLDRFALDRHRVRFLPPNQANDELFFVEEERHVRADNTFSFHALRFEAPRHLPDRTVQVRFQRKNPATRVVVYYKGERMGQARPLDAIANDRPPKKPKSDPGEAAGAAPVRPQSPSPVPAAGAATAATVNSQPSSLH
jgi:putative transposase